MSLKHLIFVFLLTSCILCPSKTASAQTHKSLDTDIRNVWTNAIPGFDTNVDEFLRFSPGVVVIGLKCCGYEGRSGWGPLMTSGAFSGALMTGITLGLKYTVKRKRPDGDANSFPSGHTAMAFTLATMLHKEYGWRSPWFSIGGYTIAAFTGVSRMMNNAHWLSDITIGAAIGIGSVHLGYYLSDLIFKGKYLNPQYEKPLFSYDPSQKHYCAEILFGRRFILGNCELDRGGMVGLSTDIPVIPNIGVSARACINSLTNNEGQSSNQYAISAGGFFNHTFAKRLEVQTKALAGCGWYKGNAGADLSVGAGLGIMLDENFKIKAFAEYEALHLNLSTSWTHSFVLGWSSAWCF